MPVGRAIDELRGNPKAIARALYGAFYDAIHIQFARDLGKRFIRPAVTHDGRSRDNLKGGDLREIGDQRIRDALSEILLFRIVREVLQGQYSDRVDARILVPQQAIAESPAVETEHEAKGQQQQAAYRYRYECPSAATMEHSGFNAYGRAGDLSRAVNPLHRRDQPVTSLRDGLDNSRLVGVVFKDAAQLGDRAFEHVIGDERVRPNCLQQLFFGNGLARATGEAHQHLHHLRLQARGRTVLGDGVETGLDKPGPCSEVVVHDPLQ